MVPTDLSSASDTALLSTARLAATPANHRGGRVSVVYTYHLGKLKGGHHGCQVLIPTHAAVHSRVSFRQDNVDGISLILSGVGLSGPP